MPRLKTTTRSRKNARVKTKNPKIQLEASVAREVGGVIYIGLALVSFLIVMNKAGVVGEALNGYLRLVFGIGANLLPVIFLGLGIALFASRQVALNATRFLGISLMVAPLLGLIHTRTPVDDMLTNIEAYGGYIGFLASVLLRLFTGEAATKVILFSTLVAGVIITFEISLANLIASIMPSSAPNKVRKAKVLSQADEDEELNIVKPQIKKADEKAEVKGEPAPPVKPAPVKVEINKPQPIKKTNEEIEVDESQYDDWQLPPLDLLNSATSEVYVSDKVLKENAEKIREKLSQFNIDVTMKDVNIGPSVLQYTLKPSEGIKLNKITGLKDDLAMALSAKALRIEAPIPGKDLVGIEAPNDKRMIVHLREMLESEEFLSMDSKLRLVVGRDVSGMPVIDDLGSMPHLLIAGATGSGKSVGMNTFLLSLLYQNSPSELKFIMIDPKRVELDAYNGIPHLLTPVITSPDKAHQALKWAVAEMNKRYQLLAEKKVRNIAEYNEQEEKQMHKIVIVIDELADLMMQANKKETEALICRIAQMARAVGMHLILATQRPSVDVITGVIKANIPTRIAFTVTSGVDSRTIIDSIGAEDLLGMGDMLYLPKNLSKPVRVQGVYVSNKEIHAVANRVKLTIEPTYDESITGPAAADLGEFDDTAVGTNSATDGANQDSLYNDAIVVIKETGKASASLLQRRLSVGYARAARILDILEEQGLIGPAQGAKPREIYLSKEEA